MRWLKVVYKWLVMAGVNPLKLSRAIIGLPAYFSDLVAIKKEFRKEGVDNDFKFNYFPCLVDRFESGGTAKGHYFHQDLLVAKKIYWNNPARHIDIGSRIDGFVAHVAVFRQVTVLDVRKIDAAIENIEFIEADLMASVDEKLVNSCDSLSCLHAIEHFGLGRYGDKLDLNGHVRGIDNLYKLLKKGGVLYLSFPIGDNRIEFNAHRVFDVQYMLDKFKGKFNVKTFSYVDDKGDLFENVSLLDEGGVNNFGCDFGCGVFELIKI